jgi:CheY-like chemotaxis protein
MSRRAGWRRSSPEPLEVGEAQLDQRPDRVLEPRLACDGERLLEVRPRLLGIDALLQTVVARDQKFLDSLTNVALLLDSRSLTTRLFVLAVEVEMTGGPVAEESARHIRVLIADDHRLFAEALEAILSGDSRIDVVGRARNGKEAVELAVALDPDVILMDISMPLMDGVEATRVIRSKLEHACVVMLTGSNSRADVDRSRAAGASGYVTKDRIASELVDTIIDVALH